MRTRWFRAAAAVAIATSALAAQAQIPFTRYNPNPQAANAAFPLQNAQGPSGTNYQVNYPYPGQCVADPLNQAMFPALTACPADNSFACIAGFPGVSNQSAGGWSACGTPFGFKVLAPVVPTAATPKFVWEVLNPPDYTPDKATFPGADYYEIGLHEAWGFQGLASAGLFPNPLSIPGAPGVPNGMQWTGLRCNVAGGCTCPAGLTTAFQATYCSALNAAGQPVIPVGAPLFTPIWGVGQINLGGGPVTQVLGSAGHCAVTVAQACNPLLPTTCPLTPPPAPGGFCQVTTAQACDPALPSTCPLDATAVPEICVAAPPGPAEACVANAGNLFTAGPAAPWSANAYVATWPSISIRANKGTPVVVKWTNEFPNSHVLCQHADAADWPCSIDRTFMGVKASIDPAVGAGQLVPADRVNRFGSPQQPDNSWVTHLHGGEIPPSTDGFAMKWVGNSVTAPLYTPAGGKFISPPFENPSSIHLHRPEGNSDTYAYPMVQEEATIWFHDHTIGKTHHNVIAGPAGFFPVKEPLKHGGVLNGVATGVCPTGYPGCTIDYTWLDPVTEPRNALGIPLYDLFLAIQDRAFNDDGSINFSNGLGNLPPGPIAGTPACAAAIAANPLAVCQAQGTTALTPGVNPLVHPTWVPEYFGDHAVVNGVLWPKKSTEPGWYRLRLVDGSDSRCYTIGFQTMAPGALPPAPGAAVNMNTNFWVIANDQGYLGRPVRTRTVTMCPGERYELLVDFGSLPGRITGGPATVYMVNNAAAPFPNGLTPQMGFAPDLNVLMRFDVSPTFGPGIKDCGQAIRIGRLTLPLAPAALTWDPNNMTANLAKGAFPIAPGNYSNLCLPADPRVKTDPSFVSIRPATMNPFPAGTIVRQVYLNEKVDPVTAFPLGMQLNGVPFEYKVTETPKDGTREVWQFINLTVDAHPMHPHLVKHQIVARQAFNVASYQTSLCGAIGCSPGPAPGGEMQVVPDVNGLDLAGLPYLVGAPTLVGAASPEGGWKDATQVPPGFVTTIVADWTARWTASPTPNAPGTAGCPFNAATGTYACAGAAAASFTYEPVTAGPYVWHCHINSHEDSEMMRTSLVVP